MDPPEAGAWTYQDNKPDLPEQFTSQPLYL